MIKQSNTYNIDKSVVYIIDHKDALKKTQLTEQEIEFVAKMIDNSNHFVHINSYYKSSFVVLVNDKNTKEKQCEDIRNSGYKIVQIADELKLSEINILNLSKTNFALELAEGIALSCYRFNKYFKDLTAKEASINLVNIVDESVNSNEVDYLNAQICGVYHARDLVNEPLSYLSATKLGEEIEALGKQYGFKTEIFDKRKIESLKMGGVLAVNKGSVQPPTFSVMTWNPSNAQNEKPIILVGKGLVFDTGGINLKPSGFLETMKSDKAGGAAVVGLMCAIAKANLPLNIIGLVPATDNRPGADAYVPQDVIKMFDGTTVEVLNTDAEGRLILADALAYAKKYEPQLVIDIATLTGAAVVAVGENAIAVMGNSEKEIQNIKQSGFNVWEKLIELPLWDEYKEQLKSNIADLKNIGGRYAGSITAGKFLEHFTDYNWMHLDIAGPAYTEKPNSYKGNGGTGIGVRLIFNYLLNNQKKFK